MAKDGRGIRLVCLNNDCGDVSSYVGLYCARCAYAIQQSKHTDADSQLTGWQKKLAALKKQIQRKKKVKDERLDKPR